MKQASECSTKSVGALSANVDFCHVGSGFRLVGTISGTGLCVVDGLMEGELNADMVKINPGATVIGEINCTRLDAAGGVQGEIKTGEVLLRSSAVINGSLSYKTIVIEKGAKIDGDIKYESSSVDHEIEHDGLESTADGLESTADGLESTNLYEVQFPEDLRLLIAGASEVKLMLKGETEESSNILALSPLGVYVNRLKFEKHIRSGGANVCQLIVDDKWFDLLIP
jgi:cytoskeletal protein CcmA (bactofilin family)